MNTKMILNQSEWGHNFRITNNGRLVQKSEILNERAFNGYETDRMMNEFDAGRSAGRYTLGSFVPPQFSSTPAHLANPVTKGDQRPPHMSPVVSSLQNVCIDNCNPVTSLGTKSEHSNPTTS